MRKNLTLLCMLGVLLASTQAFAGSIDYLSNQSAEYLMTFSKNAATDAADIASYNPAGTVFLPKDGLYVNTNLQYLMKPYEQDFMGTTYKQDEPSKIPSIYTVYKKGDFAAFFNITIPAGGGKIIWEDGNATTAGTIVATATGASGSLAASSSAVVRAMAGTGAYSVTEQSIQASSIYYGLTPGVAFKLNDYVSTSLAARYVIAKRTAKAYAVFDVDAFAVPAAISAPLAALSAGNETNVVVDDNFEYNARGLGAIFGLDVKPTKDLTLGLCYETVTQLDFKYSANIRSARVTSATMPAATTNTLYTGLTNSLTAQLAALDKDGQKVRYDLPAMLKVGINYTVMPGLDVMSSMDYYFIHNANWESAVNEHDGWEVSVGATYRVIPQLKLGFGLMKTVTGQSDTTPYTNENPALDSYTGGIGATFSVSPNFDVTLAGSSTQYTKDSVNEGTATEIEFKKVVNNVALGVQYRFDL